MKINKIEQQTPTLLTEATTQHVTQTNKRLWSVCLKIFALTLIIGSFVAAGVVGALVSPYFALLGIIGIAISLVWLSTILIARKQKKPPHPMTKDETKEVTHPRQPLLKPVYDFFSATAQDLANTLKKNFIKSTDLPPSVIVQGAKSVSCYTNTINKNISLVSIQTDLGEQLKLFANQKLVAPVALIPPELPNPSLLKDPYFNTSVTTLALSTGSSWENAVTLFSNLPPSPGAWVLGNPEPEDENSSPVIMMWNPFGFYPENPPYDLMSSHPLHKFTSFENLHSFFYEFLKQILDMDIHHVALPIFDFLTPKGLSNLSYKELIQTDIDEEPESRALLALITAMDAIAAENRGVSLVVYSYSPQYNAVEFFSEMQ